VCRCEILTAHSLRSSLSQAHRAFAQAIGKVTGFTLVAGGYLTIDIIGGDVTKRRTDITIETRRVLLISRPRGSLTAWCSQCAAVVSVITPDEAAILILVSSRTIYRWVESDLLHFIETPEGSLSICFNSISHSGEAVDRQINPTRVQPGVK
jgi:hypothetical protein